MVAEIPSIVFCTELLAPIKGWSLCPFSLNLYRSWNLVVPKGHNGDDAWSRVWKEPAVEAVAQWIKNLPSLHEVLSSIPNTTHTSRPSPGEVEAGGLEIQGHPQLHREFKMSLSYMRPCLIEK